MKMNNQTSGKVEFDETIRLIRLYCMTYRTVPSTGEQEKAIAILKAAQESGLSLDELLMLMRGNVRKRLLGSIVDRFSIKNGTIGYGYIKSLIDDLTPQPAQEAKQEDGHER